MPIVYRKNEHEQQMLMNLHKSKWQDSLTIGDFEKCKQQNIDSIKNMVKLAKVTLCSFVFVIHTIIFTNRFDKDSFPSYFYLHLDFI